TAEKNQIGRQIGQLAGGLKNAQRDQNSQLDQGMKTLQQRPTQIKQQEQTLAQEIASIEPRLNDLLLRIPLPPDDDVPAGTSADDNVELQRWNAPWFDPAKTFEHNKGFPARS